MNVSVRKQIDEVQRMTVGSLREKYREVFGEVSRSNHKQFLIRRIAWRLQELAEGGLSERARQRAMEIANDADLRIRAPKDFLTPEADNVAGRTITTKFKRGQDARLPLPGTELVRQYQGKQIVVRVLNGGFEYDGQRFRSLSAIATEVTGTRWNGYAFFGLTNGKEDDRAIS